MVKISYVVWLKLGNLKVVVDIDVKILLAQELTSGYKDAVVNPSIFYFICIVASVCIVKKKLGWLVKVSKPLQNATKRKKLTLSNIYT